MDKYRKLKSRIIEKYGTQDNFLNYSPIKKSSFIARMKGRVPFKIEEVKVLCEILDIEPKKIKDYFF